jgi:hypothetical protein
MNSVYAVVLYCVLCAYYSFFALQFASPDDVITFTAVYIVCLSALKLWLDRGVYLSLYHIVAVAYFYYIAKEIWVLNPMLSEFREFEITPAVFIISLATVLLLTALACNSNKSIIDMVGERDRSKNLYLSKWITVPLFVIYVSLMAVPAYLTLTLGRAEVYEAAFASISLAIPFLNAMGYLLPPFIHLSFNKGRVQLLLKVAMISMVFLIQVGIGNRFILLFSFFIFISMIIDVRKIKLKNVVLPLLLLSTLSVAMTQLRSAGETVNAEAAADSEGIIYYTSGLVKYYKDNPHSYLPVYSTFSLYFIVPRAIWPNKPELIGSWLLKTGLFHHNFSEGHSGSVSFVGPFFADFGSLFFLPMMLLGAVLVGLDRYLLKYVGECSARGIIAASFVPLVFFGYRSFNTSVAAEVILLLMVYALTRFNKLTPVPAAY